MYFNTSAFKGKFLLASKGWFVQWSPKSMIAPCLATQKSSHQTYHHLQDTSECAWTSRVPHPAKGTRGKAETATNLPGLQKLSWCHTFLHIGLQEWVGALLAVPRVQTCARNGVSSCSFLFWFDEKASNSTSLSGFCGVLGKLGAIAEMVSLQYCQDMLTKNRKAHDLNIEFHGQKNGNFAMPKALAGEGFSTLIPKNAAFLGTCPFQLINTHQTSGSLRFLGLPAKLQLQRIYDQDTFTWVPSRHTPMKEENMWPMDPFYIS